MSESVKEFDLSIFRQRGGSSDKRAHHNALVSPFLAGFFYFSHLAVYVVYCI